MIPRRARSITVAGVLSLLAHLAFFALPRHEPVPPPMGGVPGPMTVELLPPAPPPVAAAPEPPPPVEASPAAAPPPPAPRRTPRREPPIAQQPTIPKPEPQPIPEPGAPAPPSPGPLDMLAMLEARRAQRRAAEGAARAPAEQVLPEPDAATRNLQTLSGREGVGGVFQILTMSRRSGSFAFNGWRRDTRGQWREVIEVEAPAGVEIELAMVRRMIELIRSHYTGDFYWESHRLDRTVKLSARPEDTVGLEDFLVREFFGQPLVNPRR